MKKQNKKAVKSYNPRRYCCMTVEYDYGEKILHYKDGSTERMEVLAEEAGKIATNMCNEFETLKTKCKPDEYGEQWRIIFDKYAPALDINHAEYVAEYLIANNIARRGEPLHGSTALQKMKKNYRKNTKRHLMLFCQREVIDCKITDLSFNKNSEHNLAYFLHHKYGVLLLNGNTYDYCQKKIAKYNLYGNFYKKELQHYQNLLKKFYVADIKVR